MLNREKLAFRLEDYRHRLLAYPHDEFPASRPRIIERFRTASSIPRILVQTYRSARTVRPIAAAILRWQETNPEFDYLFFDDGAARRFIEEHFPRDVLAAFDSLRPAAYRADLWRYCYLVERGGVYADIRMEPLLALRTILDLRASQPPAFVAVRDFPKRQGGGFMYNAFIAAAPRHPLMVAALDRALDLIARRQYGRSSLDITGPGCLGAAFNLRMGRPFDSEIELGDHQHAEFGPIRILKLERDPFHRNVVSMNGVPCIKAKCIHGKMAKADTNFPEPNYSKFYRRRKVFR